jgi:hypothetical protein
VGQLSQSPHNPLRIKEYRAAGAVLDRYFFDVRVEPVSEGEGWKRIELLPRFFPEFEN